MYRFPRLLFLYVPWVAGVSLMLLTLANPYLVSWSDNSIYQCSISYNSISSGETAKLVSISPRFPGCPNLTDKEECDKEYLEEYLYSRVAYPASPHNEGTAGLVVICILIKANGKIGSTGLLRDPGHGRGADALRIAREMKANGPLWEPATVNGEPVEQRVYIKIRYSNFHWIL